MWLSCSRTLTVLNWIIFPIGLSISLNWSIKVSLVMDHSYRNFSSLYKYVYDFVLCWNNVHRRLRICVCYSKINNMSLFCYDVLLSHDNNSLCCHYVFIVRRSSVSCCYEDICPKTPITVDHPPLVTHPRDWAISFLGFLALSFRGGIFSLEHLFVWESWHYVWLRS